MNEETLDLSYSATLAEDSAAALELLKKLPPLLLVGSRILVKKTIRNQTRSGLVLPNSFTPTDGTEAVVLAVGPGVLLQDGRRHAMQTKPGDTVLIGPRVVEIAVDGTKLFVLDEGDVLLCMPFSSRCVPSNDTTSASATTR